MNKGILFLVGFGVLGLVALLAHSAATKFIDGIRFVKATISKPVFQINGVVQNIRLAYESFLPRDITINGFTGGLFYGNDMIATLYFNENKVVRAQAITEFTINVFIEYTRIAASLIDVIKSEQYLQNLTIRGEMKSQGLSLPIKYNVSLL